MCGVGPWIATTDENLINAVRFHILTHRMTQVKGHSEQFDVQLVEPQLERIRTALKRIALVKKNTTSIRHSADVIQGETESLRDEIKNGINSIEELLNMEIVD